MSTDLAIPHSLGWRHNSKSKPHLEPHSRLQSPPPPLQQRPRNQLAPPAESRDRQKMLLLHMPQVRLVAKSIWDRLRFAVELDDLIGYGMIGLVKAVDRFDPDRGILLKTYAEYRIRGAIFDGLRRMDWLPRSARQKERLQGESRREEERHETSLHCGTAPGWFHDRQPLGEKVFHSPATVSLPGMKAIYPSGNLGDLEKLLQTRWQRQAPRYAEANPEALFERRERYEKMDAAVSQLPRRHQQVIEFYYYRELSMKQIGELLNVHESRVSQLHAAAIGRLQKYLEGCRRLAPESSSAPARSYRGIRRERPSSSRVTACQSSSVSTPTVSSAVSVT